MGQPSGAARRAVEWRHGHVVPQTPSVGPGADNRKMREFTCWLHRSLWYDVVFWPGGHVGAGRDVSGLLEEREDPALGQEWWKYAGAHPEGWSLHHIGGRCAPVLVQGCPGLIAASTSPGGLSVALLGCLPAPARKVAENLRLLLQEAYACYMKYAGPVECSDRSRSVAGVTHCWRNWRIGLRELGCSMVLWWSGRGAGHDCDDVSGNIRPYRRSAPSGLQQDIASRRRSLLGIDDHILDRTCSAPFAGVWQGMAGPLDLGGAVDAVAQRRNAVYSD